MTPTLSSSKKSVSFAQQSNPSKQTKPVSNSSLTSTISKSTSTRQGLISKTGRSKSNTSFSGPGKRLGSSSLVTKSKSKRKAQKHKDDALISAIDASMQDTDFLQGLHVGLNRKKIEKEKRQDRIAKTDEANKDLMKQLDDISNFSL